MLLILVMYIGNAYICSRECFLAYITKCESFLCNVKHQTFYLLYIELVKRFLQKHELLGAWSYIPGKIELLKKNKQEQLVLQEFKNQSKK